MDAKSSDTYSDETAERIGFAAETLADAIGVSYDEAVGLVARMLEAFEVVQW